MTPDPEASSHASEASPSESAPGADARPGAKPLAVNSDGNTELGTLTGNGAASAMAHLINLERLRSGPTGSD